MCIPFYMTFGVLFRFIRFRDDRYLLQEDGEPVDFGVVRTGGSLITQLVQYVVEPGRDDEFYGGIGVLVFQPGEMMKNASIIARADGVPEVRFLPLVRLCSLT